MNHNNGIDIFRDLSNRYGINLECEAWQSKKLFGGVGLDDELVDALGEAERLYSDLPATAYEMESTQKEFEPLEMPLTGGGFRILRSSLMSHFDIVLVPGSRRWAMVMTHEMEAVVYGPKQFIDDLPG